MQDSFKKADELFRDIKEYVSKRFLLFELNLADKISKIISQWVISILIVVLFLFGLIFVSTSVAILLGRLCGETLYGFLAVGFFYWIVAIIIWKTRKNKIRKSILNSILINFVNNE